MTALTAIYFAVTILCGSYCGITGARDGLSLRRMLLTRYLPGALAIGIAYFVVAAGLFR